MSARVARPPGPVPTRLSRSSPASRVNRRTNGEWWWRGARVVGDFNARVLLTLMFVVVFVPLGLVWRLLGKDPLALRRRANRGWTAYPARYRDRQHYSRMY